MDLVTFTEEIRNGKLHFLCSDNSKKRRLLIAINYQNLNKKSQTVYNLINHFECSSQGRQHHKRDISF